MDDGVVSPEGRGTGEPIEDERDTLPSRPTFIYHSTVHADELDSLQLLHGARFFVHVERAIVSFCRTLGLPWGASLKDNPDQYQMLREVKAQFAIPFRGVGEMVIHIWVERLGESSCIYGFLCTSAEGKVVHARGRRTVVKLDPVTLEPAPWSELFTRGHLPLL